MNIFATNARRAAAAASVLLLYASTGFADESSLLDETTLRVDAALRATVIKESSPYHDDDFTSFFDQYRYVATKDDELPWHLDLRRLGIAFERSDGTQPLVLTRESRGWANENGRIAFKVPSWSAEVGYRRFRTAERRLFPVGTGAAFPLFGTVYNSELPATNPLGAGARLAVRRTWIGGEAGYRDYESAQQGFALTEGRIFGSHESRTGRRQDRFLIETNSVTTDTERFRGRRRELNQESVTAGLSATVANEKQFTTTGEVRFEGFRERSTAFRYSDLAANNPAIGLFGDARIDGRPFRYVPDTNRIIASLSLSGKVGRGHVRVIGHFAHLRQSGAGSPVQRLAGLEENVVNA